MDFTKLVSKRMKQIIEEKGLTQYKVYKLTNIPQSTISTILAGKVKTIKLSTIYDFCLGLGVEISEYFGADEFKIKNIKKCQDC